jgi:hypothetical protein
MLMSIPRTKQQIIKRDWRTSMRARFYQVDAFQHETSQELRRQ